MTSAIHAYQAAAAEVTLSPSGRARGSTSSPILLQPVISWP